MRITITPGLPDYVFKIIVKRQAEKVGRKIYVVRKGILSEDYYLLGDPQFSDIEDILKTCEYLQYRGQRKPLPLGTV